MCAFFIDILFHQLETYYYRKAYSEQLLLWFTIFITYSLLLGWLLIAKFQNMDKCCEEVSGQGPLQFTEVKKGSKNLQSKQASSFQKVNVLKNSEKVPYSKSSFYNQLIKYSLFLVSLWLMINTEERTLTASPCVAVFKLT